MSTARPETDPRFGLVEPAQDWLVWELDRYGSGWRCVAGAATAREAQRLAEEHGGVVAKRGQRPQDATRAG